MKRMTALCLCLVLLSLMTSTAFAHSCVDKDRDYWCDDCGMLIYHTCVDRNKDTWCDLCSCWIPHDCYDRNGDHECDQCGTLMNVNINITVTGALNDRYTTTLVFYEGTYPSVFKVVSGSPAQHTFSCAANSFFQLVVMKGGHATRTYYYNTKLSDINIHVDLYTYGDVTQDGKLTVGDVARIYAHIRNTKRITDEYTLECADLNGDGEINVGDTGRLYAHIKQTNPLW